MAWYHELKNRLSHLGNRSAFDQLLDDEMRAHVEMRTEELEAAGWSPKQALSQARREFGSSTRLAEESREAWRWIWLEDLFRDLRYASRALLRDRRFTLAAVLSLALGIGLNTAIFSLTVEFLLSEPSLRDAETLMAVRIGGNSHVGQREYRFIRDAGVFAGLAGLTEAEMNWRAGETSVRLFGMRVTDNFFDVAGVPLAFGRPIQPGERHAAVISDHFWRSRLDANPDVLGRSLVLDGHPYSITGVLPRDHRTVIGFGLAPEFYVPITDESSHVSLYGRLPQGLSREATFAKLTAACERLDQTYPARGDFQWARNTTVTGLAGLGQLRSKSSGKATVLAFFVALMVVVGLLLLIACANVANLLLARASARAHEFALRMSIGASRVRLIRQLLAESLLLSCLGTAAGLLMNLGLTRFLNTFQWQAPVPIRLSIQPDMRLLMYSGLIAVISAVMAGLLPALKSSRHVSPALKSGERQVSRRASLRNGLVVGQLTVSTILLVVAVLFARNLAKSATLDPGFDLDRTVWAEMRLVPENYPDRDKVATLVNQALEGLRSTPGVESASVAERVPFNHPNSMRASIRIDQAKDPIDIRYSQNRVGPDYFKTMGIPLIAGRELRQSDRAGAPPVAIVNQEFARRAFGAVNPVGRTFRFEKDPILIVGVVKDSKFNTLGEEMPALLFFPYLQAAEPAKTIQFMVRGRVQPGELIRPVERVLLTADGSAAVETKPLAQAMVFALLPSQIGAVLFGAIGALGLLLACIGLYGVLAYAVSRRIREVGVRVALGAQHRNILSLILRETAWVLGLSVGTGILVSVLVTRPLALFLVPGLEPTDPFTYASVSAILVGVGVASSLGPALSALRVDPVVALRYE